MQSSRVKGVKDPADYIHANETKISLSIYPVKIAARATYLQKTRRGKASSFGDTDGQGWIYHMALLEVPGLGVPRASEGILFKRHAYFGRKF